MPDVNDTPARPDVLEPGRDVLQDRTASLPINEAKAVRAQERFLPDGKTESPEREALYQNLENVGESGTQAGSDGGGADDLNPIGERTG